jgi:hypothetical protein
MRGESMVESSEKDALALSEKLDTIRKEILNLEIELSKYGFDPRRGIESYSISEIKSLLQRSGSKCTRVRELLTKLVETQERLYRELYNLAGLRDLNIDTETPEKNTARIKKWLLTEELPTPAHGGSTKFRYAIDEIVRILRECETECGDRILEVLMRVYKRDYDRYRVIRYLLEVCVDLGGLKSVPPALETLPIESVRTLINGCIEKTGRFRLISSLKRRREQI